MGGVVKGIFGGDDAAGDAADAQLSGTREGIAEQKRQFNISRQDLSPYRSAGVNALNMQLALLGLPQNEVNTTTTQTVSNNAQTFTQDQALNAFADTPGQRYLREQQEKALVRNASALGGLGGGNVRTALQRQAFNIAQTDFGNYYNRLAGISGSGQSATASTAQLGANAANNISALAQAGGQAQASGILGAQQANAGLASGVISAGIGLFSDVRLKTMIKKIGELPSGLNWYEWKWTKDIDQPSEGVIAQEAVELFPSAVSFDGEYYRVDYTGVA